MPFILTVALEMSYAVTNGSYGANDTSGGIIWMDPSLQLMRIYLTHYFLGDFGPNQIYGLFYRRLF